MLSKLKKGRDGFEAAVFVHAIVFFSLQRKEL